MSWFQHYHNHRHYRYGRGTNLGPLLLLVMAAVVFGIRPGSRPNQKKSEFEVNLQLMHRRVDAGQLEAALELAKKNLELANRSGEPGQMLQATHDVGYINWTMSRLPEAERKLRQALEASLSMNGEKHSDTAREYTCLGGVLSDLGRFDEAEPLLVKAISIDQALVGENHPFMAAELNNLAELYWRTRRPFKAVPLYQRILKIIERVGDEKRIGPHVRSRLEKLRKAQAQAPKPAHTSVPGAPRTSVGNDIGRF